MKNFLSKNMLELLFSLQFICLFNAPKFAPLALILTFLWVIYAAIKKQLTFKLNTPGLGFISLYIAYAIGIIWTNDMATASFYLENKLSFLLYPLFFCFGKKESFNFPLVLKGLIFAIGLSFFWNIAVAIPCYMEYRSFPWCFLKSHLSPTVHPTYMSVGAQMAIVSVTWLYKRNHLKLYLSIFLLLVFVTYIFLLLSLSGVLFFILSVGVYLFFRLTKGKSKKFIWGVGFSIVTAVVILCNTPLIKKELNEAERHIAAFFDSKEEYIATFPKVGASSSQTRIMLWLVATEEIGKHPFGVGTANVDQYMGANLRSKGLNEFADFKYNPHNQFLHTWLEIGIVGLVILLFIIVSSVRLGIKERNWILIILMLNLAFNCLFESMLQKQSGIMFYPLFLMILHIYFNSSKKTINE